MILIRENRIRIRAWTNDNYRARAEYHRDPFAGARTESALCGRCRWRQHHRCTGRSWPRRASRPLLCSCSLDDHKETP